VYPVDALLGLCAVVPDGNAKKSVALFAWLDTAVGVTDTVCQELSPRKKLEEDAVPVGLTVASVPNPKLVRAVDALARSDRLLAFCAYRASACAVV
jgi:hypothetical protein